MKIIETPAESESIGFRELRENADAIIAKVAKGQSFVVRRHSKALFRITPLEEKDEWEAVHLTDENGRGMPTSKVLGIIEEIKRKNPKKYGG